MHPADELKELSSQLKQHLDAEEELPPWEEILEPSVIAYYQQKSPLKEAKEPKSNREPKRPEIKHSQEIKQAPEIKKSPDLPEQKQIKNSPVEPIAEKKTAPPPQPKVNHEMFKGLCQELFPDLKFVKTSQLNQPQVVIFSPPQAPDEIQLFLQKIGEAIKNKGIETMITGEPNDLDPLLPLKLIIVERRWSAQLQETTATILPLDEIETLITHSEKKKFLWQQIRTILKI